MLSDCVFLLGVLKLQSVNSSSLSLAICHICFSSFDSRSFCHSHPTTSDLFKEIKQTVAG